MDESIKILPNFKKFNSYINDVKQGISPIMLSGLTDSAKVHFAYSTFFYTEKPICIITYNELQAKKIIKDLQYFTNKIEYFPRREILSYDYLAESKDISNERIRCLNNIYSKKAKIIVTTIEAASQKIVTKNELYKNIYERFDEIVCVSNSSKRAFNNIYKDLNKNVQVIYNLIEIDEIKNLSNEPIKFNFNKPTIISVGRLTKIKRMDLIIRAHKNIIDKGIEHDLIILGIGEEYDNLVSLTEKLNVKESVHFLGYKKNPYPYIKKADLFVMASEFEGFSLVIAESIVLGKAIVSTDNGGATELLGDMLYSELVDVNDLNALTKAIYEVLINTKIKCDLELKSKEKAKVFDNVNVMQSIHNIIS